VKDDVANLLTRIGRENGIAPLALEVSALAESEYGKENWFEAKKNGPAKAFRCRAVPR
jgi:hypothetical protein